MRGGSGAWLTSSLLTINKFSRALCGPVTSACLATFARSGPTLRAAPFPCMVSTILVQDRDRLSPLNLTTRMMLSQR